MRNQRSPSIEKINYIISRYEDVHKEASSVEKAKKKSWKNSASCFGSIKIGFILVREKGNIGVKIFQIATMKF